MLSSAIEALASVALKTPMTGTVRPLALLSFVTHDQTLHHTKSEINKSQAEKPHVEARRYCDRWEPAHHAPSMWSSELPCIVRPHSRPPPRSARSSWISRVLVPRKKEEDTTTSVIGERRSR
jgi:hypothetical protein